MCPKQTTKLPFWPFAAEVRSRSKQRYRERSRSGNRSISFSPRSKQGRYNRQRKYDRPFLCSFCKREGHTRKFCYELNGRRNNKADIKFLGSPMASFSGSPTGNFKRPTKEDDDDEDLPCMMISSVNRINEACYVEVLVEKSKLTMEIDCGSAETVISEGLFLRNFKHIQLLPCNKKLAVIDGKKLTVLGRMRAMVQLGSVKQQLYLIVLRCDVDFVPLMGRTWLDIFYKDWRNVFSKPAINCESIHRLEEDDFVEKMKYFARWSFDIGS